MVVMLPRESLEVGDPNNSKNHMGLLRVAALLDLLLGRTPEVSSVCRLSASGQWLAGGPMEGRKAGLTLLTSCAAVPLIASRHAHATRARNDGQQAPSTLQGSSLFGSVPAHTHSSQ